jgi:hypothetical protein
MTKFFKNKAFLASLIFSTLFISCQEDDTLEDVRSVKAKVTADITNVSLVEGESATITLTIDEPLYQDTTFKIDLNSDGSTGSFRDFSTDGRETTIDEAGFSAGKIGYIITFPAYQTTAQFTIDAVLDLMTEPTEVLSLRLSSTGNGLALVDASSETIKVTINDLVSNDLGIELDWTQTYADSFGTLHFGTYVAADGNEYEYADYDFDFYVFDSGFNEVSGFAAATGAAPEMAILDGTTLADGVYEIYADKYDNAPASHAPSTPFQFEMSLTVSKFGTWSKVIPISYYSTSTPVSAPNGLNGGEFLVARFTKAGSVYTLNDPDTNEVLAQGRLAQAKEAIKNLKKNKLKIN